MPSLPDWSGISFAQPDFLWLLLLVPLLAWLKGKFGGTPGVLFSTTKTVAKIGGRRRSRAGDFLTGLLYLALIFLVLALARPQEGKTITRTQASGVDIMLVIDVSRSMLAEDFTIGGQRANRLEAVKQVTETFISERPNDRIGIVAFAGRPYLVSPLTLDHDWLRQNLERTRIGLVEDGTAIGSALAAASNRLKDKEAKSKLIVLLTDGDNNMGRVSPMTAAEAAQALGIKVYTIGSGNRGTAPFPVGDAFGRTVYRQIPVEFDEEILKEIATTTGGTYFRATDTQSLQGIFNEIDEMEKSQVEVQKIAQYKDIFPWFVLVGAVLLAAETVLGQTIWRRLP
ncbi:MAG: VWA domain-containing protein [Chthoniobacterales bacterium]